MRKIIDIFPPQTDIRKLSEAREEKTIFKKKPFKKKPLWGVGVSLLLVFCLVGIVLILLTSYSRLTVNLTLSQEPMELQEEVRVDVSQGVIDFQNKVIPGKIFEVEEKKTEIFQATGKDFEEGKAEGFVLVHNTQNPPMAITLRANTRFLSSEGGKIFRAIERFTIPPAQIKDGKLVAGTKEIKVVAEEAGEDYNIGASKFSVPGLSGTELYFTVWAESTAKMTGGFKKEVKKITKEDLERGKDTLRKHLGELAQKTLRAQVPADYLLPEMVMWKEDDQYSCQPEAEIKASEFNCEGKIKLQGIGFKRTDLEAVARHLLLAQVPVSKTLVPQSLSFNFLPNSSVRETGKIVFGLRVEGKIYTIIPLEDLLSQIKGQDSEKVEEIIFENYPQVEAIELKFWPFWISKAPKAAEKIKIGLTFAPALPSP